MIFRRRVTPDFSRLHSDEVPQVIDVVPENWHEQGSNQELRLFRTGSLGKLALNLARGNHYVNSGNTRDDRTIWMTNSLDEARELAKAPFVTKTHFRPGDAEELAERMGVPSVDIDTLPTVTYGITMPVGARGLRQVDDTAYQYDRHIGFGAMDEHSRAAIEDALRIELPKK